MTCKHKKSMARASRRGFTVVEVIVASSILVISVLATVSAFSYARRTVSRTENRLACLHIAREVMETLRSESYRSTLLDSGTNKRPLPGYPRNRGYYDVEEKATGKKAYKDITVVIEWTEPGGMEQSVSLKTSHSRGKHQ